LLQKNVGQLLFQFFLEHEIKQSDATMLPADTFIYVSGAHGSCSCLDHYVSLKSVHDSIQNIEILHQFILSDHRLVATTIKTTALPENVVCDDRTKHEKNINWNKATQQQKLKYQLTSKIWL